MAFHQRIIRGNSSEAVTRVTTYKELVLILKNIPEYQSW